MYSAAWRSDVVEGRKEKGPSDGLCGGVEAEAEYGAAAGITSDQTVSAECNDWRSVDFAE